MRILAIETVDITGSVALLEDGQLLTERALGRERRSAQSLVPGIQALLTAAGWRPADLQLIAVARGPGSFTGLRIGVTTAKALAYGVGCEVMGVHTLEAVASQVPSTVETLSVVLDAGRNELFVGSFHRSAAGTIAPTGETQVVPQAQWLAELDSGQIVSGPALTKLATRLPAGVVAIDAALWSPTAASVGRLGWQQYAVGRRESLFDLVPHYYRRTAAEEQWERRHG